MLSFGLDIKNSQCHEVEITFFLMRYILKLINFYGMSSTYFRDDCHTHIDSVPIFQCQELESIFFVTHILELIQNPSTDTSHFITFIDSSFDDDD